MCISFVLESFYKNSNVKEKMEKDIKVSIIIPVYNTSMYLDKCLNSLLNQTLNEIEIICVNDGSTDDSLIVLQNFAQKDGRVKIIDQKNQGQSVARNAGIKEAKGEYIGFIDSDDWADVEMFERLYGNAKQFNSDLAMCSITMYDEKTGNTTTSDPYMTLDLFPKTFENRAFNYTDTLDFIFRICVVPWNKLYRREFLQSKKLAFVEGLNFEDNVFNLQTIVEAQRISLIKEPLVFYRKASETSYTFGKGEHKKLDFFKIFDLEEEYLQEKGIYNKLEDYFIKTKKNTLIYWYKKLKDEKIKAEYYQKLLDLYPQLRSI